MFYSKVTVYCTKIGILPNSSSIVKWMRSFTENAACDASGALTSARNALHKNECVDDKGN